MVPSFRTLILHHGYVFLFCYVLAVQAGMPIPADPVLLIMGATVGDGHYRFSIALLVSVLAAVLGDSIWYELGRWRGRSILALLCRFALEPDTCVRKTEVGFMRRGAWSLLFMKFVPGMSLISTPLAGAMKMPRWQFLLADAAGSAIWCTTYLLGGVLFRHEIDRVLLAMGLFGRQAGAVLAMLFGAFVAYRYFQRWRFRRQLRINRITPSEVVAKMDAGEPLMLVDLRAPSEIEKTGFKLQGAKVLRPAELRTHFEDLPADRDVVLYCT